MTGARRAGTSLLAIGLWMAVFALGSAGAPASVTGTNPCPALPTPAGMGDSVVELVQFPYVPAPDPMRFYEGAILRPADTATYPGKRPAVVLQHGWANDMCSLWWAAQYLAGHGYVVTLHETPFFGDPDDFFIRVLADMPVIIDSDRAVIDYLGSVGNVFADYTDAEKIGYAGHGVGSMAASYIPGGHPEMGIDAVVALNNLRALVVGDPGGVFDECFVEPQVHTLPTVPALGIAMDEPCASNPTSTGQALKLAGWDWWKSYAKPAMELVMDGYGDSTFVGDNNGTDAWADMGYYMDAWFGLWLEGDESRKADLTAQTINGRSYLEVLSRHYQSAIYLPPDINNNDLAGVVEDVVPPPDPTSVGPVLTLRAQVAGHRIRQGLDKKLRVFVGNRGDESATATVCLKAGPLKIRGDRCHQAGTVVPGASHLVVYWLRAGSRVKAGRTISTVATLSSAAAEKAVNVRLRVIPRYYRR